MYAVIMTDSYVNLSKMHVARGFVKNYLGKPIAGAPHALLEARHLTENAEGLPYSWPDALELDTRISEVYYDNIGLRSCDFVVPTCEVRNRVFQVAHVSLCIDLDELFKARDTLNYRTCPVNSLHYRENSLRTVRETSDRIVRTWLLPDKKYFGGLLVDWESPMLNYRRCHAKMYNRSPCLQIHCQMNQADAYASYRSLKDILLKLDDGRYTAEFATSRDIIPQDFRCVLENSRIDLNRVVNHIDDLVTIMRTDAQTLRDNVHTIFPLIDAVSKGHARIIIRFKMKCGNKATATICSTGRGYMSSTHPGARVFAYIGLLHLMDLYSEFFAPRASMLKSTDEMAASEQPSDASKFPNSSSSSSASHASSSKHPSSSSSPPTSAHKRPRIGKHAQTRPSTPVEGCASVAVESNAPGPAEALLSPDVSAASSLQERSEPARSDAN